MSPPGKFTVNFYPEANGKGEPLKESTLLDESGAVIPPKPGKMGIPGLAVSMSITFDDPAPLAEIVPNELPPPEK
jgi:hypothetical protein